MNTELQNHIRRHETVTPAVYRARLPKDDTASEIANAHGVYGELAGTPAPSSTARSPSIGKRRVP